MKFHNTLIFSLREIYIFCAINVSITFVTYVAYWFAIIQINNSNLGEQFSLSFKYYEMAKKNVEIVLEYKHRKYNKNKKTI